MAYTTVWHGTRDEAVALLQALQTNCECHFNEKRLVTPCAVHRMLAYDQRAVDGLLFMRHVANRLLTEEFLV